MDTPELILKRAAALISGPRAPTHENYRVLHQRIAQLWSAYLDHEIQPEQAALCLALVSVAGDEHRPQLGYSLGNETLGELITDVEKVRIEACAYAALWAALSKDSRLQDPPPARRSRLAEIRKKFKVAPSKTTETASSPLSNDGSSKYFTELVNWETDD